MTLLLLLLWAGLEWLSRCLVERIFERVFIKVKVAEVVVVRGRWSSLRGRGSDGSTRSSAATAAVTATDAASGTRLRRTATPLSIRLDLGSHSSVSATRLRGTLRLRLFPFS